VTKIERLAALATAAALAACVAGCSTSPPWGDDDAASPPSQGTAGADGGADAPAPTDADGDAPDALADAPPLPEVGGDAACTVEAGALAPTSSLAYGAALGPNLSASLCAGSTVAYLETAATIPYLMVINGGFHPGDWHIDQPTGASYAGVVSYFGVDAMPGKYSSAGGTCGTLSLCLTFPVPASLDCTEGQMGCPAGCAYQGPASHPTCMPITPSTCYVARSASSCLGSQTPRGSWTLTLASIGPFVHLEGGALADGRFMTHGTLTATLEADGSNVDAGAGTAALSLAF
jgi:hypothetical protein